MAESQYPKHPFLLSVPEVEKALDTRIDNGLSTNQVPKLQEQYGDNELDVGNTIAWYTIFIRQLCNAMVLVRTPFPQILPAIVPVELNTDF